VAMCGECVLIIRICIGPYTCAFAFTYEDNNNGDVFVLDSIIADPLD
jgi:hypothetical protein